MFRDVGLVGGAVYQRASNLEWKVRPFSLSYKCFGQNNLLARVAKIWI